MAEPLSETHELLAERERIFVSGYRGCCGCVSCRSKEGRLREIYASLKALGVTSDMLAKE